MCDLGLTYRLDHGTLSAECLDWAGLTPAREVFSHPAYCNAALGPGIEPHANACVYDSIIQGVGSSFAEGSVVQESLIRAGLALGQRARVKGLWGLPGFVRIPAETVMYQVPLRLAGLQEEAFAFFGPNDSGKERRWFDVDILAWLDRHGIPADRIWPDNIAVSERTLWDAELFPVGQGAIENVLALHPLDHEGDQAAVRVWLESRRVSFEQISRWADFDEIFRRFELLRIGQEKQQVVPVSDSRAGEWRAVVSQLA